MGRRNCISHCAACGRHFTGDRAFDMHRRAGRCLAPIVEVPRLAVITDEGRCSISGAWHDGPRGEQIIDVLEPVSLYGVPGTPKGFARGAERHV